jgi:hypothetical protein
MVLLTGFIAMAWATASLTPSRGSHQACPIKIELEQGLHFSPRLFGARLLKHVDTQRQVVGGESPGAKQDYA